MKKIKAKKPENKKVISAGPKKTSTKKASTKTRPSHSATELKKEADKYKNLFLASRDAIMTVDPSSGKFMSGNPAALKMFKIKTEKEFMSYHPWQLSPQRQQDGTNSAEIAKNMDKVAILKGSNKFEWLHKRTNGEEFVAEVSLSRFKQDGHVLIHSVVRDITEHKKALRRLAWLASFPEQNPSPIVEIDQKGTFYFINPGAQQIFPDLAEKRFEHPFLAGVDLLFDELNRKGDNIYREVKTDGTWYAQTICLVNLSRLRIYSFDITERKKAEEEIKFKNLLLLTQQETSIDGILVVDGNNKIISFNEHFSDMWGFPLEILKKRAEKLALNYVLDKLTNPKEFLEKIKYLYEHQNETSWDEIALKDGRVFERYSASAVEPDGRYYGRVWYFRDITVRKQAEADTIKEKSRSQQYLNIARVMFLTIDSNGMVTLVNKKTCEVLGYEQEELIGRNWFNSFIPEREKEGALAVFKKLLTGEVVPVEYYENAVLTKSGEERLVAWHNAILRDESDNITGILTSGEDVTERGKAEKSLRESEERFRAIFENSADGILLAHPKSMRFFMANHAMYKMLGYTEDELKDLLFSDMHFEKDRSYVVDQFERMAAGEFNLSIDLPVKRKDGSLFYADVSATNVMIGTESYMVCIFRDVTKIREAEALAKASNIKDEFLSLVSHDLKSPLHVIKRAINLLIDDPKISDEARERAAVVLRQANRGLRFVDNLLQLRQLKSGEAKLDIGKFNLLVLLNSISKDYKFNLEQAGVELKISPNVDCEVVADKEKIGHVISNIIDNAIKFTPKGGSISVNASLESNELKVSISDTGRDIPPEKLEKIFRYYEQARPADVETGMGIGLSISELICQLHGGKIWAESGVGKGATFIFTIPNMDVSAILATKNILIVDDVAEDRSITRAVLEKENFQVYEAGNWKEAMEKIHSCKVDAVLLDIQMPDVSGLELLEIIRKEKSKASLPVIIYSSKTIDTAACFTLGANSCVSKGAESEELIKTIRKVVSS